MMEALRHSLMIGRLALRRLGRDASRRSALGDRGSARCLGRDDIGALRRGRRPTSPCSLWTGLAFTARRIRSPRLVLCGAHRADRVMVAGDWRVVDGAPVGIDLEEFMAHHREAARAFA